MRNTKNVVLLNPSLLITHYSPWLKSNKKSLIHEDLLQWFWCFFKDLYFLLHYVFMAKQEGSSGNDNPDLLLKYFKKRIKFTLINSYWYLSCLEIYEELVLHPLAFHMLIYDLSCIEKNLHSCHKDIFIIKWSFMT